MDRWIKEAVYIRTEQDKGSYQLSHVYDKLFAAVATSSGERKSTIRRRSSTIISKVLRLFLVNSYTLYASGQSSIEEVGELYFPSPFPLPSPPPFPLLSPPFLSLPFPPFPSPPLRGRPPLLRLGGLGEPFSSPSGSGRSPAAKRYLVNFRLKISPLVATIFKTAIQSECTVSHCAF